MSSTFHRWAGARLACMAAVVVASVELGVLAANARHAARRELDNRHLARS